LLEIQVVCVTFNPPKNTKLISDFARQRQPMVAMKERRQDFELLQRFRRDGEQSAFRDVVRRHLDLVFATALRKVADAGGAQEISQNVFSVLARKAWRFAPDDSLPAWLYKTTLLESKSWLRGELRRRRREETAAELGTTMNSSEDQTAFNALVPLLDDALLSLREKDRTALLLRYYESHSLRDVGAAFGVSEDTAQKRVQSALEKLAEFFKRRGFKTATVAAAAAALQHTAVSTSTAMVCTVVGAALQVAPPALVGLGALLARLASWSRVQTTAVCVALAAVPVGWQLNERHLAGEEAKRLQTQLLAAQSEGATVRREIERLRALSGNLEQSVTQANDAAARAAASAQAFAAWKQTIRGPLTAADYRWSDASAFVRIPKAILPKLSEQSDAQPFSPPGVVNPYARELMGLTSTERQSLEESLQRQVVDLENKLPDKLMTWIQETNRPLQRGEVASKRFSLPALPDGEVKTLVAPLLAELHGILGEERWPLTRASLNRPGVGTLRSILNLKTGRQDLNVRVAAGKWQMQLELPADGGGSSADDGSHVYSVNITGNQNGALSMFLPEGDPNQTRGSAADFASGCSEPLRQRVSAWLQQEAAARLGKEKP
jgi:RNA polymerase sigma factor (sigma-70 family)